MKNFKLLLATTAILSTGALAVFASWDAEETMDVEVNIVVADKFEKINDIDFATIIANGGEGLYITMNPSTGEITTTTGHSEEYVYFGEPQIGEIKYIYGPDMADVALHLPASVELTNDDGNKVTYKPSYVKTDEIEIEEGYYEVTFGIGGTLLTTGNVAKGHYTGSITITCYPPIG